MSTQKILILDNVRSAHNVGSLFRTSDGAGVTKLILFGYTPAPKDRFGREHNEIKKTSLGASETVPYEQVESEEEIKRMIFVLKQEGYTIVAVEQTPSAIALNEFTVPTKVAYILGNEIEGVSQGLLDASDLVIHVPMLGKKESLNVSVAGGIVLFKN